MVGQFEGDLSEPSVKSRDIRVPERSWQHSLMQPTIAPERLREPTDDTVAEPDKPWLVIVWNDPINLMSYVTWVFQKLFGYSRPKATKLMLDVHHKGRAVVSSGPREKAELDCFRLHAYGLWATISKSD
jgi:ATP-dependent Clp protease adaptor protein ClpS